MDYTKGIRVKVLHEWEFLELLVFAAVTLKVGKVNIMLWTSVFCDVVDYI